MNLKFEDLTRVDDAYVDACPVNNRGIAIVPAWCVYGGKQDITGYGAHDGTGDHYGEGPHYGTGDHHGGGGHFGNGQQFGSGVHYGYGRNTPSQDIFYS